MRNTRFKGVLLSTLIISSLTVPAIPLIFVSSASALPERHNPMENFHKLLLGEPIANALIILDSPDVDLMQQSINFIRGRGGRIVHIYPPHVLIGYVPGSISRDLIGRAGILEIHHAVVDPSALRKYGKTAAYAADAWNNNFMGLALAHGLTPDPDEPKPRPIIGDALVPPVPQRLGAVPTAELGNGEGGPASPTGAGPAGAPYGAGFYDTSEYMIGSVAVGVILPESSGAIDPSSEDWTHTEESNVTSEVQAGLNWWAAREANANLSFTYDFHYAVPTGYEPITRPSSGQSLWIDNVMVQLGYTEGTYFDKVQSYLNDIRATNGTDWSYAIFVVDDTNDPDKEFTDGYCAYAYLGGPFVVMTYGNNDYGIANMDYVTAHETGHTFYATDEYNGVSEHSGYENVLDSEGANCMMNLALNWNLCPASRGQIGWWDNDGDGILNILDTFPETSFFGYAKSISPYEWTPRVSTTSVASGDDVGTWITLPFGFPFWGELKTRAYVCSNGFIIFDPTPAENDFSNSLEELKARWKIAPFWDDLRTDTSGGIVSYPGIYVDNYVDKVVVTWEATSYYASGDSIKFQAILHSNGDIRINMDNTTNFWNFSPTLGISSSINYIDITDERATGKSWLFILTTPPPSLTSDNTPTFTGFAQVVPLPNKNPYGMRNNITLTKIANVQYRVDGGSWVNASAVDGAFDNYEEYFTFTTSPLADGTHTIEVRAINSVNNVDLTPTSASITVDTTPPATPMLVWPVAGENINDNTPTLEWNPVPENSPPVLYRCYVDNNLDFLSIENDSGWVSATEYTTPALAEGLWHWKVGAKDNLGNIGDNSAPRSFKVDIIAPGKPTLLWPANGENINDNTPNLDWGIVSDNSEPVLYRIYISDNSEFPYDNIDSSWISDDNFITSELAEGWWYWRVQAKDNAGNIGDNSQRTFRIDTVAPPTPTPYLPADGTVTNGNTVYFEWSSIADTENYDLFVDNNPDFSSPEVSVTITDNYYTSSPLPDENYSWKVRVRDAANNVSDNSATRTFLIDTVAPNVPTLVAYTPDPTYDNTPTLDWDDVAGATYYRIQIDNDSDFLSTVVDDNTLTVSTYTPTTELPDGAIYWHVSARDDVANWSAFSAADNFTVDTVPPGQVTLYSPENNVTLGSLLVNFEWYTVTDPSGVTYTIQIDNEVSFSAPLVHENTAVTDNSYSYTLLTDGTYYWRVSAIDAANNESLFADNYNFTVDTQAPSKPVLNTPDNNATVATSTPTFRWTQAEVFENYTLQIANDVGFTSLVLTKTNLTDNAYTLTVGEALADDNYYWRVRAVDGAANEGEWSGWFRFEVPTVEVELDLYEGWNLMSLPILPDNQYTASSLLAELNAADGDSVVMRASDGTYHNYVKGYSTPEDDFEVIPDYGYYVRLSADASFTVVGRLGGARSALLNPGWNLIGWTCLESSTTSAILTSINADDGDSMVMRASDGTYHNYVKGYSTPEDDFVISYGNGYYIRVATAKILQYGSG